MYFLIKLQFTYRCVMFLILEESDVLSGQRVAQLSYKRK